MTYLPSNLPALLRAAGLSVVEIKGWQTRGRPASTGGFAPVGVLNHHTGASAKGWTRAKELAYAKWMALTGRTTGPSPLPPPLCHLSIGRSGTVYIIAAGRANHAGKAKASGSVAGGDGNRLYVGIEWMLSGTEAIPAKMMQVGITLNAVLTEKVTRTSVNTISCHYQTSVTGKWDIGDPAGIPFNGHRVLDVNKFREQVADRRKMLYSPKVPTVPKTHKRTETIAVWNAYVGQTGPEVVAGLTYIAKRHDPDKIMLQEIGDEIPEIKAWAKAHGFRVLVGKRAKGNVAGMESQSSAILVHKRLNLYSWVAFHMQHSWIGPKHGIRHPGRTFVAEVSGGIRSAVVHMPTEGTGRNAVAFKETIDRLEKMADNRASKVRPLVLGGDWNAKPGAEAIKELAKHIGAEVVYDAKSTDFALVRGTAKGKRVLHARVFTGTKRGSDHAYIIIRLYWAKK